MATKADDDYDPHLYRKIERPTTNAVTLIHMLKGCIGTGILAMPEAFKDAGLINGCVFTVLLGILFAHCTHMLIRSQYILCKRLKVPLLTYPESVKVALESGPECLKCFAEYSWYSVGYGLVCYQLITVGIYMVFVAVHIKAVCSEYINDYNIHLYILALIPPFIVIHFVRDLKKLIPFSIVAIIITICCFGIVCYYIFQELPDLSERPYFSTLYNYPLFLGSTSFALHSIAIIIALENNMETPKNFGGWFGVFNISMFCVTLLSFGFGFTGFWRYGNEVKTSIILNFPIEDVLVKVISILYSTAIFISCGLQGYIPFAFIWFDHMLKKLEGSKHLFLWEYIIRIALVVLAVILAMIIPKTILRIFISLIGTACVCSLGIIFPCIMQICILWPEDLGCCKWILIKNICLIILSIVAIIANFSIYIAETINIIQHMIENINITSINNY